MMLNGRKVTKELLKEMEQGTKSKTNADRIRAMSDRELLAFLVEHDVEQARLRMESKGIAPTATQMSVLRNTLQSVWGNWLRQPAEVENGV